MEEVLCTQNGEKREFSFWGFGLRKLLRRDFLLSWALKIAVGKKVHISFDLTVSCLVIHPTDIFASE